MMMKNVLRPHHLLDPWRDSFVTEMRLRNVSGPGIGDALAQVDGHCTESGEQPEEAFGSPVEYATQVAQQVPPEDLTARASWPRAGLLAMAMLVGIQMLLSGVAGLGSGGPAELSVGMLVGSALGAAGIAVLVRFVAALHGPRRRGLWFVGMWLVLGARTMPPNIWTSTAVELGGWLSVGVALVLVGVTWASPLMTTPERVVDPLTGGDSMPTPRWLVLGMRLSLPVFLVGAVLLVLLPVQ